jgi:hypothetical protein
MTTVEQRDASRDEAAFLRLVQQSSSERCREIEQSARTEARRIEKSSRTEAARRVTAAVRENRARSRDAIDVARAKRAAELRLAAQDANRRHLELAWPALVRALETAWLEPEARRRWTAALLDRAVRVLSTGTRWVLEHPPDLDPGERSVAAARIAAATGKPPELRTDERLKCGLRVISGAAVLDGSVDGLLLDRPLVEGRLLSELDAQGAPAREGGP